MSQSLGDAGVGILRRGGEFVGSGKAFMISRDLSDSGAFLDEYPGLLRAGVTLIVDDAKSQSEDFTDGVGGPSSVVMRLGVLRVAVDLQSDIFA